MHFDVNDFKNVTLMIFNLAYDSIEFNGLDILIFLMGIMVLPITLLFGLLYGIKFTKR